MLGFQAELEPKKTPWIKGFSYQWRRFTLIKTYEATKGDYRSQASLLPGFFNGNFDNIPETSIYPISEEIF